MVKLTEISKPTTTQKRSTSWGFSLLFSTVAIVVVAMLVIQLDTYETVAFPLQEVSEPMYVPARKNSASLSGVEKVGSGLLIGPEDIVYEPKSGVIYTGCHDGWIKRVTLSVSVADLVVENWVHTGGQPLGLAIDESGDVFVADAYKGLLKVSVDGKIELLTDEAEGIKVGLADGVVVAKNGMVYFTDATYKYNYRSALNDLMEGRPHGRLLSYDPSTKETKVIARDLYFANGVELSPNQDFVIFCETFMRRCSRYYLHGEKKGYIDVFAKNLPGLPDNVRYDGDGHYWMALPWDNSLLFTYTQKYQFVRKIFAFTLKHLRKMPDLMKFGGVIVLDLEGKVVGGYYDETWGMTSSGVKIGESLYLGSVAKTYITRLNLTQHPLRLIS
ncbi:unnamed protein product [Lactuca saligna]|uniref:Strictosidine synthase conserved region domain-containing protein n=1 Tax=Lactuca saligna TaxID=75948 RepID=A0AA35ZWM9_LACSI|nr:unnamed protein product [Lactuca saligna]